MVFKETTHQRKQHLQAWELKFLIESKNGIISLMFHRECFIPNQIFLNFQNLKLKENGVYFGELYPSD